jgi:sulfate adenylyltransferase
MGMKDLLIGGKVSLFQVSDDQFQNFRLNPVETRVLFKEKKWRTIVGFQTRNTPHLGHEYVQKRRKRKGVRAAVGARTLTCVFV